MAGNAKEAYLTVIGRSSMNDGFPSDSHEGSTPPENANKKLAVTIAQAAWSMSVSQNTNRNWISNKKLKAVKLDRIVRIPVAELERLLWE